MKKYRKNLILALVCFLIVIVLNFFLPRLLPGNPIAYLTGFSEEDMTPAQVAYYRQALHLDKPVFVQFGYYLRSLADGTLGYSFKKEATVSALIGQRLGYTLQITLPAVLLSTVIGLLWGLRCGYKKGSSFEKFSTTFQIIVNTMPTFLIALVLMILFCFRERWFPYTGLNSAGAVPGTAGYFWDRIHHLILPVLTLTVAAAPSRYLLMRNTVRQVTEEKYVLYAKELGFKMAFVPGYSPNAIAELAVTHAMMLLRHLAYTTSEAHKGNFVVDKHMFSKEIRNCTVGVIGLGRIGRVCAQIFHGMGAKVVGQDVFQIKGIDDYATQVEMDELLKVSDVISLHCPYIKENGKVVTREFISKMKDGAILVNAARGQLVDTEAVIEAIESGKLGGFAADTLDGEADLFGKDFEGGKAPNAIFQKLIDLYPKVLLSPHLGSFTDEAVKNMVETTYENLKEYMETGDCKNKI